MIKFKDVAEALESTINGFSVIRIKTGKFEGIEFTYGSVYLKEDEAKENATIQFEYNLVKGEPDNVEEFNKLTGDLLISILEEQLNNGEVIYHGGKDDDTRTS